MKPFSRPPRRAKVAIGRTRLALPTYPFSDPDPVPAVAEIRYPYFRYDKFEHRDNAVGIWHEAQRALGLPLAWPENLGAGEPYPDSPSRADGRPIG